MSGEEKRALELAIGELREALASMPPFTHSIPAERMLLAASRVGLNNEAIYLLGAEAVKLLMGRVGSSCELMRMRSKED